MHGKNRRFILMMFILLITFLSIGCSPQDELSLQSTDTITGIDKIIEEDNVDQTGLEETDELSDDLEARVMPIDNSGEMIVHFVNVDQGDATLIQTPNGKAILIDAGEYNIAERLVSYIKNQGIDTIDVLIATHPHADHIGGMVKVIESFNVGKVYMPKVSHTTRTFENLLLAIQEKGLKINTAKAGVVIDIDPSIQAIMLAPNNDKYDNLNDYSTVLKVVYGESSFMVTGDVEATSEREIIAKQQNLKVDVLRVAHHGSSSSTIDGFLKATAPTYGVISVGADNKYGHPHDAVLLRLNKANVEIYRTDIHGNIVFLTDGKTYNIRTTHPNPKSIEKDAGKVHQEKERININTATLEELQEIIHIGPAYAQQIIELRPFTSIDELVKVNGIGAGRLQDIKEEGKAYVE